MSNESVITTTPAHEEVIFAHGEAHFNALLQDIEQALQNAYSKLDEKINWSPDHIKAGRFGNWLEGARDWSISRQRYWASVMPIWKCAQCGQTEVFGSVKDLRQTRS